VAVFVDARVRLERATANCERLRSEMAGWLTAHRDAYMAVTEADREGNVRIVAHGACERPPEEWGLRAGDILVDLRSVLDYAVYALAIANAGKDPPLEPHRLEFPICPNPDRWKQAIGRRALQGLCRDAIDYIESIQPYKPGNGGSTAALAVFEDLVGVNKHRFIHAFMTAEEMTRLDFQLTNMEMADFVAYKVDGALKDGTVLASFRLIAKAQQAKIEIKSRLTPCVGFEPTVPGGPYYNAPFVLGGFCATVEHYLGQLERYL
jgi:hypothetical protein